MIEHIHWLGHGSFYIEGCPSIFINPWRVTQPSSLPADFILISDDHYHHFSPGDIAKLRGPNTRLIAHERAARELEDCLALRPWQSLTFGRLCVKGVPAYLLSKHGLKPASPSLGFILSLNFYDIYYAGLTSFIPEMASLRPDIAILPVNSDLAMSPAEAADAVRQMRPRWVFPSHWSLATRVDAYRFEREVGADAQVLLPALR